MAKRDNHYEAAFEAYLQRRRIAYVAVDEHRRSPLGFLPLGRLSAAAGGTAVAELPRSLKNLDFLVNAAGGWTWLVDVKGRRFPSPGGRYFRNWSTQDDLASLARWQELFGESFQGLFVFAYNIEGERSPLPAEDLFAFRQRTYGFVGVRVGDYAARARVISPKWGTVAVPTREFRQLARPLSTML